MIVDFPYVKILCETCGEECFTGKICQRCEQDKIIADLRAENERLREAHKLNTKMPTDTLVNGKGHFCSWRRYAEAMVQRSKAALRREGE